MVHGDGCPVELPYPGISTIKNDVRYLLFSLTPSMSYRNGPNAERLFIPDKIPVNKATEQ